MAEEDLQVIAAIKGAGLEELTDEQLEQVGKIKYAVSLLIDYPHYGREKHVKMIMEQEECSRSHAYKLIAQAIEIYPSMERVSKEFERARLARYCYQMLHQCRGNEDEYRENQKQVAERYEALNKKYDELRKEAAHVDQVKALQAAYDAEKEIIERGRITHERPNLREGAQYVKLLKELYGLDNAEDISSKNVTVINVMKYDIKSLGVTLEPGFDVEGFIKELEDEHKRKPETINL